MTRRPATQVRCSYCATPLPGTLAPGRKAGYKIGKHKRPDGTNCVGNLSTQHAPVEA